MADYEKESIHLKRIFICIKVDLASGSIRRAALAIYIVIVTAKQWVRNNEIF